MSAFVQPPTSAGLARREGHCDARAVSGLPVYAEELTAFHLAFAPELKDLVDSLPLRPSMHVLDVGCGDGFYSDLFAHRLRKPGGITGVDTNADYLDRARDRLASRAGDCKIDFIHGRLDQLPLEQRRWDVVWCAQSLYTLPDPVTALRQMAAVVRPGGVVAVLENDSLHQLLLPWPDHIEIALRRAEFLALSDQSLGPEKYYIGRRLPEALAAAGLEPVGFATQSIDRKAPLDGNLMLFLQNFLDRITKRASRYLDPTLVRRLKATFDCSNESCLLRQPFVTVSWLNILAWGRRPRHS